MPKAIQIDLWGTLTSRAFRVLWALEELEVPYNLHDIDFKKGDNKTEEFLKMNPNGKIPVLKFGETILFESGAIVEYLASQFPEKKLAPALNDPLYAKYLQWNYFALAELEQPLWAMAKHKFALPQEFRLEGMKKTAGFEFKKALAVIEQAVNNKTYLLGEHFYACDILVGHILLWARSSQHLDESHPHSLEYLRRLKKRKAILGLKK